MKDLKRHEFTGGCPRCADLELGKAKTTKAHSEECRARIYRKFQDEKHEKYTKVRTEMERAKKENLPIPSFVDLDAADYDKWLAREITRERVLRPPQRSAEGVTGEDDDVKPPESKRPRHGLLKKVDASCDFDEDTGFYVPTDGFRARNLLKPELPVGHRDQCIPVESSDRDWRYPPNDYRHHRRLAGGDDDDDDQENGDDAETAEPDAKRARAFELTFNARAEAGVDEADAKSYCNEILGGASDATLVELYGRGAIVNEANGPRRNLGVKGLSALDLRTTKLGGGNWDFCKKADRKLPTDSTYPVSGVMGGQSAYRLSFDISDFCLRCVAFLGSLVCACLRRSISMCFGCGV